MKAILSTLLALALFAFTVQADVTVKVSDVHLCCGKCVNGVKKAVATVPGVTADVDQDGGTVTLTGPDNDTLQKAADALTTAGYYGTTGDSPVKLSAATGAKGAKVTTLTITGVHICCGSCAKAVKKTVEAVPGVTGDTVVKGAASFEVTGDFTDSDVLTALQKAGFTGKVQ